jgi:hypothetical protein
MAGTHRSPSNSPAVRQPARATQERPPPLGEPRAALQATSARAGAAGDRHSPGLRRLRGPRGRRTARPGRRRRSDQRCRRPTPLRRARRARRRSTRGARGSPCNRTATAPRPSFRRSARCRRKRRRPPPARVPSFPSVRRCRDHGADRPRTGAHDRTRRAAGPGRRPATSTPSRRKPVMPRHTRTGQRVAASSPPCCLF